MTNTILNVSRELLERVLYLMDNYIGTTHTEEDELRALLSAPSPAGVDVLEVIGWYTDDHLDDKSATTYSREVADRWLAKGWPVTGIANAADAQAIIDGLRGENERIRLNIAEYNETVACYQSERDTLRQQLAEARDEITQHSNDLALAYMNGGADMRQQRDRLAQILRDLVPGCKWRIMRPRIDAALAEIDNGN